MIERVRTFLGLEALSFWTASLIHSGVAVPGYQHRAAMLAEAVIAMVLTLGLLVVLSDTRSTRTVGLTVQALAMLGTLAGIFAIVVGIGPQSRLDMALHAVFVLLLVAGLTITASRPHVMWD